jgi:hypothetical protein
MRAAPEEIRLAPVLLGLVSIRNRHQFGIRYARGTGL